LLEVVLNGEVVSIEAPTSISKLVDELKAPTNGVAVAVNREIVPRSKWDTFFLSDQDAIEVVTIFQGG